MQATTVLLSLFNKQHFRIGLVQNIYRDDILFSVPYQLILALIFVSMVSLCEKWYWKLIPLILNILMDIIFARINILVFGQSWNLFYLVLLRSVGFVIFILLEKYTLKFMANVNKSD